MRVWCNSCIGKGSVHQLDDDGNPYYGKCPNCDGKGYREMDVYKYTTDELSELERLAEIGRATEKAFKEGNFILNKHEYGKGTMLENIKRFSIKELLDWAKED